MSTLTNLEKKFNYLYVKESELDKLLEKENPIPKEQYQKNKLKEEISDVLSDIFSLQCDDALSTSFFMQVDFIEQKVNKLLEIKHKELDTLYKKKSNVYKIAEKIFSIIYSIDILQNSIKNLVLK